MLEGKCPKCGAHYYGWSLRFPRNQMCSKCGTALEITEDGEKVTQGYSPFTAEEYTISRPAEVPSESKKKDEEEGS